MVQVRAAHPTNQDGSVNIDAWIARIGERTQLVDPQILHEACEWAQELEQAAIDAENIWADGASSYRTGLEMAEIWPTSNWIRTHWLPLWFIARCVSARPI